MKKKLFAVYIYTMVGSITVFGGQSLKDINEFNPFEGPKPIAVLLKTNPWLMVVGSDIPKIVIYEDGQVIYLKQKKGNDSYYLYKKISQDALNDIKKKLESFGDFSKIKRYYSVTEVTDQPETMIYLDYGKAKLICSVYGLNSSPKNIDKTALAQLPKSFVQIDDYLTKIEFGDSTKWEPDYIEVMIWPYEYAEGEPLQWPKNWPDLSSPYKIKREDSYSIFMRGSETAKLQEFLEKVKEKQAVEISGKKWAMSFRQVFPSEPIWRKAFKQ